jgi:hypothetical protein
LLIIFLKIFEIGILMKKIAMILLFISMTVTVLSQENKEEIKTLFGNGKVTFGGYGAVETKFSSINNQFGVFVGGRGGVIINHSFILGLGGYGLTTSHKVDGYKIKDPYYPDSTAYLRMGYGGLHIGYIIEPNEVLHISTGLLIGGGWAGYTQEMSSNNHSTYMNNNNFSYESTGLFIAEPSVGAELNITNFFRIELNANYRFVSLVELPVTKSSDLGGFSGSLAFKFGKF